MLEKPVPEPRVADQSALTPVSAPSLAVRNLVLEADRGRLIDGLDLSLDGRALTVIMGPNGAGKSLLLRLIHGLIQATRGTITWDGVPVGDATRARQAMVFQRPVLLRRSVRANMAFVLALRGRATRTDIARWLDYVDLAEHAGQPARLLSGGEQQRLALARALAAQPGVLLLDEPTASLDPASTAAIERLVQAAHRGGTKVIFVTHDVGQARRLAGDVVFVNRGRVVEHAPADAFFDQPQSAAARAYLAGRLVL